MERHRAPDAAAVVLGQRVDPGDVDPPADEESDGVPGSDRHPPRPAGAQGEGPERRIASGEQEQSTPALGVEQLQPPPVADHRVGRLPARGVEGMAMDPPVDLGEPVARAGQPAAGKGQGRGLPGVGGEEPLHGAPQQAGECQGRLHRGLGATGLDGVECLAAHAQMPSQLGLGPALEEATFADEARHGQRGYSAAGAPVSSRGDMEAGGPMLTERDLIMRLVRQLAEMLAAALRLRREGKREEALVRIDQVTGRLTGMDAGALCLFGGTALAGIPPELRLAAGAAAPRPRPPPPRGGRCSVAFHQALRAARTLVRSSAAT